MAFHLQTDGQTKQMNQKLEQYLQFFVDHRQKDWPEWLALVEFAVNNKDISVYGKLWKRIKNGERYQEKWKDREGNRICRKNEEGA